MTSLARPVVFIVDDDVSYRGFLKALVESAGWQTEAFASATQFLSRPRSPVPGCLVLDVVLPDLSGLDVQQRLLDRNDLPIIFLSGQADVPTSVRAMKAGASEFLTKPCRNDVLLQAIRQAVGQSTAALHEEAEIQAVRARYTALSQRERQVMELIVSGRCRLNKQVGGELGISEITVKAHRGKMMRKMDARSLPHLVGMAALLGLSAERRG